MFFLSYYPKVGDPQVVSRGYKSPLIPGLRALKIKAEKINARTITLSAGEWRKLMEIFLRSKWLLGQMLASQFHLVANPEELGDAPVASSAEVQVTLIGEALVGALNYFLVFWAAETGRAAGLGRVFSDRQYPAEQSAEFFGRLFELLNIHCRVTVENINTPGQKVTINILREDSERLGKILIGLASATSILQLDQLPLTDDFEDEEEFLGDLSGEEEIDQSAPQPAAAAAAAASSMAVTEEAGFQVPDLALSASHSSQPATETNYKWSSLQKQQMLVCLMMMLKDQKLYLPTACQIKFGFSKQGSGGAHDGYAFTWEQKRLMQPATKEAVILLFSKAQDNGGQDATFDYISAGRAIHDDKDQNRMLDKLWGLLPEKVGVPDDQGGYRDIYLQTCFMESYIKATLLQSQKPPEFPRKARFCGSDDFHIAINDRGQYCIDSRNYRLQLDPSNGDIELLQKTKPKFTSITGNFWDHAFIKTIFDLLTLVESLESQPDAREACVIS